MVVSVDESDIIETLQFNDEILSKLDSKTIALMSNLTNENILKKLNKENLFLFEIFLPFYSENCAFNGFSVGEIALNIITLLNPKSIYLLGLDLALNQKTGASHSQGSNSAVLKVNLDDEQTRDIFNAKSRPKRYIDFGFNNVIIFKAISPTLNPLKAQFSE
jgi:hypothetical protein